MDIKKEIIDYVLDHYRHFDAFPIDVEIDGIVYNFEEYWAIIEGVKND